MLGLYELCLVSIVMHIDSMMARIPIICVCGLIHSYSNIWSGYKSINWYLFDRRDRQQECWTYMSNACKPKVYSYKTNVWAVTYNWHIIWSLILWRNQCISPKSHRYIFLSLQSQYKRVKRSGINITFCIDVNKSMIPITVTLSGKNFIAI